MKHLCVNENCVMNQHGKCRSTRIAKACEKRVLPGQVSMFCDHCFLFKAFENELLDSINAYEEGEEK